MKYAFYVSDHGFGHVMRSLPVIEYLLRNREHEVIVITGKKQAAVIRQQLVNCRLSIFEMEVDYGLNVIPGTLLLDKVKLEIGVANYVKRFPVLIKEAAGWLKDQSIDKVVCDIVPWSLTAAKKAGIPSYLMCSFTWLEIYEEHLPNPLLKPMEECFSDADTVLMYQLANEKVRRRFPDAIQVGLCAREFDEHRIQAIRALYTRPIVFLSIGGSNFGINSEISVEQLPYDFIVTAGLNLKGSNVTVLPIDVGDTQNYVASSDYCIIKSGWSTVAEALISKKPMAVIARDDVAEDRMTAEMLVENKLAIKVKVEELQNMHNLLLRMSSFDWVTERYINDAKGIAEIISS